MLVSININYSSRSTPLLQAAMPHSVQPDDFDLPDAPSETPSEQERSGGEDGVGENGIGKHDNLKIDIKLEDLFNDDDDDEDEEFPSTDESDGKVAGSPPAAPM